MITATQQALFAGIGIPSRPPSALTGPPTGGHRRNVLARYQAPVSLVETGLSNTQQMGGDNAIE
jgi:hypothetical protein